MTDFTKFRTEIRDWLTENCPPAMRQPMTSGEDINWGGRNWVFQSDDQRLWMERMAARGWTVPTWPREYGGGGLTAEEASILAEEMKRIHARTPLFSFGIHMLGPALLKYGNDSQKKEYLPAIAEGKIRWCQGYSEPGAGSDLAGLRTKAEDKGDYYLVNGQKVWTSYADKSDWIFCLVRTDPEAPKHKGISFLLIDMASEGVSTKPIRLISGRSPFCETFFDNVQVPKANLVGEENKGWDIAKYLLTHEREMIGGVWQERVPTRPLHEIVAGLADEAGGLAEAPMLRERVARQEMGEEAFALTMSRLLAAEKGSEGVGARSSMLKLYGTELNMRKSDLMMSAAGLAGLAFGEGDESADLPRLWLRSKGNSIEGGTHEIQLNIIAKRILGLPG